MNLFGRTLGGEEIASLVFMAMALVIWIGALRNERLRSRWLRRWEADRKARRETELAGEGGAPPPSSPDTRRGPWG